MSNLTILSCLLIACTVTSPAFGLSYDLPKNAESLIALGGRVGGGGIGSRGSIGSGANFSGDRSAAFSAAQRWADRSDVVQDVRRDRLENRLDNYNYGYGGYGYYPYSSYGYGYGYGYPTSNYYGSYPSYNYGYGSPYGSYPSYYGNSNPYNNNPAYNYGTRYCYYDAYGNYTCI